MVVVNVFHRRDAFDLEAIWGRVFIGHELAKRINEGVPEERRVCFQVFPLRDIPQPRSFRRLCRPRPPMAPAALVKGARSGASGPAQEDG
jgi:hypothetical protein